MKTFDVQTIEINAPYEKAFDYIAEARNLPKWTSAFKSVSGGRALIQTPNGSIEVALTASACVEQGTIDWMMTFPDGSLARACSRLIPKEKDRSIYCFILLAPPVPLEQLEGTLRQQSQVLREELARLRQILDTK